MPPPQQSATPPLPGRPAAEAVALLPQHRQQAGTPPAHALHAAAAKSSFDEDEEPRPTPPMLRPSLRHPPLSAAVAAQTSQQLSGSDCAAGKQPVGSSPRGSRSYPAGSGQQTGWQAASPAASVDSGWLLHSKAPRWTSEAYAESPMSEQVRSPPFAGSRHSLHWSWWLLAPAMQMQGHYRSGCKGISVLTAVFLFLFLVLVSDGARKQMMVHVSRHPVSRHSQLSVGARPPG